MSIRPLQDRVLVEPLEAETKSVGGIIIPDSAQEKPQQGKVVAVGPGKRADNGQVTPPDVKKGDTVMYGKWSGTEIQVDGKAMMIMSETDIMGIVG